MRPDASNVRAGRKSAVHVGIPPVIAHGAMHARAPCASYFTAVSRFDTSTQLHARRYSADVGKPVAASVLCADTAHAALTMSGP